MATFYSIIYFLTFFILTFDCRVGYQQWPLGVNKRIKVSHYKSIMSSLSAQLPPSTQHRRTEGLKSVRLPYLKLKAIKHSSQYGVSPGSVRGPWPLPSAELSCWPVGHLSEVQVGPRTVCRGGKSMQSFDLLLPWVGSNESVPAKLQWGSEDK